MSDQDDRQAPALQLPSREDAQAWKVYWQAQGQPWRTEPEIDVKRQEDLARCRATAPDIEKGRYPFKDVKLSRADIEWLLSTHESRGMRGPVDWSHEHQRGREGLDLRGTDLCGANLSGLPLAGLLGGLNRHSGIATTLEQRVMAEIHLEKASLRHSHLEGACLTRAHLEGTDIEACHLEKADLYRAHLEGASLRNAYLGGASLRNAYLDTVTILNQMILVSEDFGIALTADIHWDNANIAVVNWKQLKTLGEEHMAKQPIMWHGQARTKRDWLGGYLLAVRANRQLAIALQGQGLNEDAAHFAYRAQALQKTALWYQMAQRGVPFRQRIQALESWLLSWFLFLLAGYGYKPIRSGIAYLVIIFSFMGLYLLNAHFIASHLTWDEALVLSVSSFHGRGFFTQSVTLGDTYARLAAIEAVVGLFIEISFIATFTQRFFGK